MALSSQPTTTLASDGDRQSNRFKRHKPSDSPQSTDTSSEANLAADNGPVLDVQADAQGRRYIVVVCGGRSGNMYLDKFYKLPGNKGYEKCILYNDSFVAPHEFESICGMKAMKAWKKSIKHNSHPLLTYLSSGILSDSETDRISFMIDAKMDAAFRQMETRLVSSVQEVIRSSIDSLRSAFEVQVSALSTQVSDLSERVNKLENERIDFTSGASSQNLTGIQPD